MTYYNDPNRPRRANNDYWSDGTVALVAILSLLVLGALLLRTDGPRHHRLNTGASTTPTTTGTALGTIRMDSNVTFGTVQTTTPPVTTGAGDAPLAPKTP
jgi:hypothetical protein